MNLRKIDDATMFGASFCIGRILGTYQSDRVTTVTFVNHRQPSIITLCSFLFPPKKLGPPFVLISLIFVVYVYDFNAIIVHVMPSRTDAAMVTAFNEVILTLVKAGGYTPTLNVMDNECSAAVEKYIKSEKIGIQLVPPHNHRVNATEHTIATFKERFIAVLATVDTHCPLQLWDEFLPQVELTLNMLRFSRRDPKKSANQEVYGTFDFNNTPLAPLGTKALIYDDPASHASWTPHVTDGFYVGPASDHYRCLHFYIPTTQCFHFTNT